MSGLSTARIPFNVKLTEGNYKGEAIGLGDSLQDNCMFEIRLLNGGSFLVKAEEDKEIRRYNWTTQSHDTLHKLVPVIGRVIERFFAKS
jgi:hypothetical protein